MTKRARDDSGDDGVHGDLKRFLHYGSLYSDEDSPLQAFFLPTTAEVISDLDENQDGLISPKELRNFAKHLGTALDADVTAEMLIQQITPNPDASTVPCKDLAESLDQMKNEYGDESWYRAWSALVSMLNNGKKTSTTCGWLVNFVLGKYQKIRVMIQGRSFAIKLYQQDVDREKLEQLERARARTQVLEEKARARTPPERTPDGDLKVSVKMQVTNSFGFVERDIAVCSGDTLDDVYSRYVRTEVESVPASLTQVRDAIYAGEHQPSWVVVQKGCSTKQKGYTIKNFDLTVGDLGLTKLDSLIFATPYLRMVEVFFVRYKACDALVAAPESR